MKQTMKKLLAAVAIIAVATTSSIGVFAEYDPNKVLDPTVPSTKAVTKPDFKVTLNGELMADVDTYVSDDYIMIPIRAVAEKLGFTVGWNAGRVTLTKGPVYVTFAVGEDGYTFAKTAPMEIGKAPELTGGLTYVPDVFFKDILEAEMTIDQNGTITINYGETAPAEEKVEGHAVVKSVEEVKEGENPYTQVLVEDQKLGDVILNITDDTDIVLADGKKGAPKDIKADMKLVVDYSPAMTRSLPPQNSPEKITVVNEFPKAEDEKVEGKAKITKVDGDTVTVEDEKLGEVVLNVSKETEITLLDGKKGAVKDLKADMDVDVVYGEAMTMSLPPQNNPKKITVVERNAEKPEVVSGYAEIESVKDNTVTVADEKLGEVILNISDETEIVLLDGKKGTVKDLKEDMDVQIVYGAVMTASLPPQNTPAKITVVERDEDDKEDALKPVSVEGKVVEIGESGEYLTCLIDVDDEEAAYDQIRLIISDETKLYNKNGKEINMNALKSALKAGKEVEAVHSAAMTFSIPPQSAAISITIEE